MGRREPQALLTTTMPKMGETINALKEAGIRDQVKIMIDGGAPVTGDYAERIGADGHVANAAGAVRSFVALLLVTTIMGFARYTAGLRHLQASVAPIAANAEVPFAAFLSYMILGERLDQWQVLGAFLIVGGVTLVSPP
jgi:uncharacterized membrane protein